MQTRDGPDIAGRREPGIEVARSRVLDRLIRGETDALRVLCAPSGAGKSTALRQYAKGRRTVRIIVLPSHATGAQVDACLSRSPAAGLTIIDDADTASPAGRAALLDRIEGHIADGRRYLLSGSSRIRLGVQPMLARGIAALLEPSLLPFTPADIGALAAAHGIIADPLDIEQLHFDTDGWPIAVALIVREAALDGRGLRGAFERWHERHGPTLLEHVFRAHDRASARAFVSVLWSFTDPRSQRMLERLDAQGFPIVRMRSSLRPYRILTYAAASDAPSGTPEPTGDRLVVHLLGRFTSTVGARSVVFERRRDQNVLAYLALAPGASVMRTALLETFWPGAPPAVASQGLRTTLCRLRRALAAAAGADADRFLRVAHAVSLNLESVDIDARAFLACIARADADRAGGDRRSARQHYQEAQRLYTGSLLASEAVEAALAPYAEEYEAHFSALRDRLLEIATEDGTKQLSHPA